MFSDKFTEGVIEPPLFSSYNKGARTVYIPNDAMRKIHKRFLAYLRQITGRPWDELPSATGAVPYGQTLFHITRHERGEDGKPIKRGVCQLISPPTFPRYLFIVDLAHAYESVDGERLSSIVSGLDKCSPIAEVHDFLMKFCLIPDSGGLITGAPTAPDLFNLYTEYVLDRHLRVWSEPRGVAYTRYVDDLLFSAHEPFGRKKRRTIREIIETTEFRVNDRKVRIVDLHKGPVVICGIGVRANGSCFLPRKRFRRVRGVIHLLKNGKLANVQEFGGRWGELLASTRRSYDCAKKGLSEDKLFHWYSEYQWSQFSKKF